MSFSTYRLNGDRGADDRPLVSHYAKVLGLAASWLASSSAGRRPQQSREGLPGKGAHSVAATYTGHTTKQNRRYAYYVCRKAQQQGAVACPGQSIPAARIEGRLLAGLQGMAAAAEWQPLREALQGWSALERVEQRRRLARVLERIDYDGRRGGTASVRWRAPLGDGEPSRIPMRTNAAQAPPPPEVSFSSQTVMATLAAVELGFTMATEVVKLVSSHVRMLETAPASDNGTTAS
jgi:hypothetical protein